MHFSNGSCWHIADRLEFDALVGRIDLQFILEIEHEFDDEARVQSQAPKLSILA
jgi:hypothetical protein